MTEYMVNLVIKRSHKEWRKLAKKARRKRIRQKSAEERAKKERLRENSPSYLTSLAKTRLLEEYELELGEEKRKERYEKWLKDEEEAQRLWKEQQRLKDLAHEEKLKEQQKIRDEWELEQKKIQKRKEELEKLKKEEQKRKEETLERINDFMIHGGRIPIELDCVRETNPGKELCLFFSKVGACRFGSQCSRNHQHPGISNVLLFNNFYSHFTLQQNRTSEYDTDIGLEYEDSDTYSHFREFYNDVVPELKSHGTVVMVKVCCNNEIHLRGNLYVEYKSRREALISYHKFQGRWYGGKQLNIEFVKIQDWASAVCGDFSRKRCPKGNSCNFLHVFRNPRNEFPIEWRRNQGSHSSHQHREKSSELGSRHWRWSESPEPVTRVFEDSSKYKGSNRSCRKENGHSTRKRRSNNRRDESSKSRIIDK